MRLDITRSSTISQSPRARQLEALFDVPRRDASVVEWHGDIVLPDDWHVGLIVGPSGSGKTTLARELFGKLTPDFAWSGMSVVDDFDASLSMDAIAHVCQAVGFNTIPAWLRPYDALSTGERFRVALARHLLESSDPLVVDEFTSVVDRQVAQIGAHAVQKYIRKHARRFVAVSCHYDIIDWLQPDWVIEQPSMHVERRSVQSRPALRVTVEQVSYAAWATFAHFHYLTDQLNTSARCFVLFVDEQPASFAGVLHRPHAKAKNIKGVSRAVTLPDWQGLGLAFVLCDTLASAYTALGWRLHMYPAHPAYIRSFDRSQNWAMQRRPASFAGAGSRTHKLNMMTGGRPCAVFAYVGPQMPSLDDAQRVTGEQPFDASRWEKKRELLHGFNT